jgi:hypothetical protein
MHAPLIEIYFKWESKRIYTLIEDKFNNDHENLIDISKLIYEIKYKIEKILFKVCLF